ncbi:hypothetical protein BGX34_008701 [Mortierella sp. NVP85]|nr:hypothetical protein BGX34_008701 [Mortierella sp. NVP85]
MSVDLKEPVSARMIALPPVVHQLQAFVQEILGMSNAVPMVLAKPRVEPLASASARKLALDPQAPRFLDCVQVPGTSNVVSQKSPSLYLMTLTPKLGGGHAATPGPSLGTCVGYTGSIMPCPADKTVGLNCSGLVRDAIYQGTGIDLAHGGNSHSQLHDPHTHRITYEERQPGDIEFFGTPARTNHVILYVGRNATGRDMMIEAQRTGTDVHEVPLRTGGIWARVRK